MMNRALQIISILTVSLGLTISVHAAELVVVASTAPDFEVGTVVDGSNLIRLVKGSEVTFITSAGQPVKLVGPYEGVPDAPSGTGDPSLVDALSAVIRSAPKNASTAGVMRASMFASKDPWVIDVGQAGDHCVALDKPPMLWRAIIIGPVIASLKTGGQDAEVAWTAGSHTAPWPAELPLRDGQNYELHFVASKKTQKLTLHRVPDDLPTDAHKVVWMHEKGCAQQAAVFLARLQDALGTPDRG